MREAALPHDRTVSFSHLKTHMCTAKACAQVDSPD